MPVWSVETEEIMPIVIKEMHVRTVVEKRIITEADVSEELLRKIEDRVRQGLSVREDSRQTTATWRHRKKNER